MNIRRRKASFFSGIKMIIKTLLAIVVTALLFSGYWVSRQLPAATGFVALYACGDKFVSKRKNDAAVIKDAQAAFSILELTSANIDHTAQTVSAALPLGLFKKTAVYNSKIGCTLATNKTVAELRQQALSYTFEINSKTQHKFIVANKNETLETLIDEAFKEPTDTSQRNTRAIIVIKNGQILAERYATGFNQQSPLLGWSMTKSLMNAITGILIKQSKLTLTQNNLLPLWQNDQRANLTIENLLNMDTGLAFAEVYGPGEDATIMLFNSADTSAYAADMPLEYKLGTHWSYSSGTTNLLAHMLRKQAGLDAAEFYDFMYRELFNPLGMTSMVIQTDESGDPIASSFGYATARDWAKFGLLYLNNGVWSGQQILPKGWTDYTRMSLPYADKGGYKAQFWLNTGEKNNPINRYFNKLPTDFYAALGHDGQQLMISPSLNMIVVRLGRTIDDSWDENTFISDIIEATTL
jgi:CubicO group peptidase (beta-lactamase class C family)